MPAVLASRHVGWFLGQPDTRTLAERFVASSVPPGSTVLLQPTSVQLVQSRESLVESLTARLGDATMASRKFVLRLRLDPWPAPAYRLIYLGEGGLDADKIYAGYGAFAGGRAAAAFERLGVDYVVLKRYPVEDPATEPLRSALEAHGRRLARFSPYREDVPLDRQRAHPPFLHNTDTPIGHVLERPGPIVEVWTIR
jgi:hypothetical protein